MSTLNMVLLFFYFLAEVSTNVPLICTLFQKLIFFGIGFVSQNQGKLAYFFFNKSIVSRASDRLNMTIAEGGKAHEFPFLSPVLICP